jgi:hypothetical protein
LAFFGRHRYLLEMLMKKLIGATPRQLCAVELSANVIDSAANYRFQRSERSVGAASENFSSAALPGDRRLHERRLLAFR